MCVYVFVYVCVYVYACVYVYECVCVCVYVYAYVCVCVCVCGLSYPAFKALALYLLLSVVFLAVPYFSTASLKRHNFQGGGWKLLIFFTAFL